MFTLVWTKIEASIAGKPIVKEIEPSTDRFTIGRSTKCDHEIQALGISRIHCTLIKNDEGKWIIIDGDEIKKSTYGIFYPNGEKISEAVIKPGQTIVLLNSAQDVVLLKRDKSRTDELQIPESDLTIGHEISTESLVSRLNDQTGEIESRFELMMSIQRTHQDAQLLKISQFLETVYDETKRLRTDFSVAAIDDTDRDKQIKEQRMITRALAVILGCAGLWLLVKDQQTASNIAGIVIMVGGAIGWGKSNKN